MVSESSSGNEHLESEPECFRKLSVGGISPTTTEEMMRDFYGKFGELTDCVVETDPVSNESRGFGFITYTAKSMVDECMRNRPHEIDGKTVYPKRDVPREKDSKREQNFSSKQLYVSGIKANHTEAMLSEYFSQYGTVEKVQISTNEETRNINGFAFVNFDDHDPVDQCILLKTHQIDGIMCDIEPKMTADDEEEEGETPKKKLKLVDDKEDKTTHDNQIPAVAKADSFDEPIVWQGEGPLRPRQKSPAKIIEAQKGRIKQYQGRFQQEKDEKLSVHMKIFEGARESVDSLHKNVTKRIVTGAKVINTTVKRVEEESAQFEKIRLEKLAEMKTAAYQMEKIDGEYEGFVEDDQSNQINLLDDIEKVEKMTTCKVIINGYVREN